MRTPWLLFSAMSAALLLGCRTAPMRGADAGVELSDEVASQLAGEFVPHLRAALPPARATLTLAGVTTQPLRSELERRLRKAGFAIANTPDEAGAVPIECTLSRIADRQFRLTLRAGEAFEASRAYEVGEAGEVAPVNQMTLRTDPGAAWAESAPDPAGSPLMARTAPKQESAVAGSKASRRERSRAGGSTRAAPPHTQMVSTAARTEAPPVEPAPARPRASDVVATPPVAQPLAPAPAPASVPGDPAVEDVIVLSPNRERVVEISGALFSRGDGDVPNPFLQQYQPKVPAREMTLAVCGVVMGPHPTAVLNERVCSVGETIDGFRIESIQADLVVLRWENFMLRIPAEAQLVTVRYP